MEVVSPHQNKRRNQQRLVRYDSFLKHPIAQPQAAAVVVVAVVIMICIVIVGLLKHTDQMSPSRQKYALRTYKMK
jgi:hypothetical protein